MHETAREQLLINSRYCEVLTKICRPIPIFVKSINHNGQFIRRPASMPALNPSLKRGQLVKHTFCNTHFMWRALFPPESYSFRENKTNGRVRTTGLCVLCVTLIIYVSTGEMCLTCQEIGIWWDDTCNSIRNQIPNFHITTTVTFNVNILSGVIMYYLCPLNEQATCKLTSVDSDRGSSNFNFRWSCQPWLFQLPISVRLARRGYANCGTFRNVSPPAGDRWVYFVQ
jgi:hypothetical protein